MTSRVTLLIQTLEYWIGQEHLHTEQQLEDMKAQLRIVREEINGR